jgi:Zn-dependent protease
MSVDIAQVFFYIIVFLFAISVHESAHAWMANRCGDPTAMMLGRITLNPIKHIDPIGTVLLPAISLFTFGGILGWAKPTPVDPRNFRNPVAGDILTTAAGPISNFLIVAISLLLLIAIAFISQTGRELVRGHAFGGMAISGSLLDPIVVLLFTSVYLNVLLGIFNLIPVPPLDGSHIFRHMLPDFARDLYDKIGMFGLLLVFLFGGRLLAAVMNPVLRSINAFLVSVTPQ